MDYKEMIIDLIMNNKDKAKEIVGIITEELCPYDSGCLKNIFGKCDGCKCWYEYLNRGNYDDN